MSGSARILVIDDNPADVRLIEEAVKLLDRPVKVYAAANGEEALRFLRREQPFHSVPRPNLIFLDFNLPRTDSREVLRIIKGDAQLQDIAVAVLTSSSYAKDIQDAYALRANCYLIKPQSLEDFFHTIGSAARFWLNHAQNGTICYDSSACADTRSE